MKNYVLSQLLKRCPLPTLQFVSGIVLPVLKRDFIGLLPVELAYQILGYLDLRTIGRCLCVSRSWKRVVDGEGAELSIWKKRLVAESFADDAEIAQAFARQQAIEAKAAAAAAAASMSPLGPGAFPMAVDPAPAGPAAAARRSHASRPLPELPALAAPSGYPRSSGGSVYKSLYKRHHLIRRNWLLGRYKHVSFQGHGTNVVTCLQFDTERIVSGSDDQTIHIYNTANGRLLQRLQGHEGGVWALQYWKHILVSGSTDRSVRVWDIDSARCTHIFDGHTSTVRCLLIITPQKNDAFEPGLEPLRAPLLVTGSRDATLRVWRLPDPRSDEPWTHALALERLRTHQLNVEAGLVDPKTPPPSVENPYLMHILQGHTASVRAVAGQGNVVVSGSYDCTVRVWNLSKGVCEFVFEGHREKVYSVGYSHELRRAVSGSLDTTIRVWCTRTGIPLFTLEGHTSLVGLLELSPRILVSAAADATLRIWSPVTGQCLATLTGHPNAITCFHHDPRYNRIVSGADGGIKIWELSSFGYTNGPTGGSTGPNCVIPASSPLGGQLSYAQGPNGIEPVYGRFIRDVVPHVTGVWRVRMDESRLVCAVQREDGTWFEVLDFSDIGPEDDASAPSTTPDSDTMGGGPRSRRPSYQPPHHPFGGAGEGPESDSSAAGQHHLPHGHHHHHNSHHHQHHHSSTQLYSSVQHQQQHHQQHHHHHHQAHGHHFFSHANALGGAGSSAGAPSLSAAAAALASSSSSSSASASASSLLVPPATWMAPLQHHASVVGGTSASASSVVANASQLESHPAHHGQTIPGAFVDAQF
ncbi:SCF ubiquitin ligase complex subunit cdc4 [Polyrhizophydium stewartii]|uniref:SCF ubiquitin ligase complex subunit cdc4 n=1 Tax=Polyrhizophydium stewartii TaxID=2732419 RepID=A0ABR4NE21_9FUNG